MHYFPPAPPIIGDIPLDHLDPIEFSVRSDKIGRYLRIRCRFSNHVYTISKKYIADTAKDIPARIFHGEEERYFSHQRWTWSLKLPRLISIISNDDTWIRETTSRRNWMYAASIDLNENKEDLYGPYLIFFSLKPGIRRHNSGIDLEMFVESAYRRGKDNPYPPLLGRAKFGVVASGAFLNKPVHTRRS